MCLTNQLYTTFFGVFSVVGISGAICMILYDIGYNKLLLWPAIILLAIFCSFSLIWAILICNCDNHNHSEQMQQTDSLIVAAPVLDIV